MRTGRSCLSAGFTLVEMLLVAGIIVLLSSFSMVAILRQIERGRDAQTRNLIASISTELVRYQSAEGGYPGARGEAGADETLALYRALRNAPGRITGGGRGSPYLFGLPVDQIGLLKEGVDARQAPASGVSLGYTAEGLGQGLPWRLDDPDFQTSDLGRRLVFVDGWGNAIHYREWASKPDVSKAGAMQPLRFDLWSNGSNGIDELGSGDDIR